MKNGNSHHIEAAQQLLSGDTSAESSTDSSRISSASHSRNSSTGIPNNPALPATSITISSDVVRQQDATSPNDYSALKSRQQDATSPMTTVLSSFMPVPKIHKTLTDSRPEVVSKQALLDPDTKLPNV